MGAQPLAPRHDEVARPRTQVAQEPEPGRERHQLVELPGDVGEERGPGSAAGDHRARGARVLRPERADQLGDAALVAADGVAGDGEQRIRRAGHRRDHHDGRFGTVLPDDSHRLADRGGVGQRGPAELVDVRGRLR